ncbi:hypothetical protein TSH7_06625 [Azospirillum sp. TSH7]|uniref:DUF1828 domain-containing protein n=1 Tax=unclassified Azospirillum TaxID=2630922 RepID=UPI000D6187D7|nr:MULTISPECIES: DUF1828 domain-containing protein [unclassified Azospirillum]PWC63392.1 hypothetical protein TSH20_20090 [Azospirillum sp. TSH20]PWC66421.1 hypothetical protein TSH7_06625 [Azospirillum sp. TSH7]
MLELIEVKDRFKSCPLVEEVDLIPKGHVRISTAFRYPDGSSVDVFIANRQDMLSKEMPMTLTDFGNTFLWLDQVDIRPLRSARRRRLTFDILETYGIEHSKGVLSCNVTPQELAMGVIRLGQACIRVADLIFTHRVAVQGSFQEEVESIIEDISLDYEQNAKIIGRGNTLVPVDFLVRSSGLETAIFTLPAESSHASVAKARAENVFARCYDLRDWQGQRVAALDDRRLLYRDEDIGRIREVATIVPISQPEAMRDLLLAA